VRDISDEYLEEARLKRGEMLEKLSDVDDEIMEKYVDEANISAEDIKRAIRRGTIGLEFFPVLFGASFKNKGVHPLLDAVVDYLPSPVNIPPIKGHHPRTFNIETRRAADDEPFSALVFKIMNDPYAGTLSFFRVYSGKTKVGASLYNASKEEEERVTRLLEMYSNKRKEIKEVYAGDIAALGAMKNLSTGDTLCLRSHPIVFEPPNFPEPVVAAYIEPRSRTEHVKLSEVLDKLTREDPTFKVKLDPMTGQTLVYGMGELHLEILMDRMDREFGVKAKIGKPQVAYKETIADSAEGEGRYVRQSGGRGQYGHCRIIIEPLDKTEGFEFIQKIKGGHIPKEFVPSVKNGIREAMEVGILAGFPMTGVKATLIDGSYHEVDSTPIAFKIAGSLAFKDAAAKAKPLILEPIMSLVVISPDDYLGDIVSDIRTRRGRIEEMDMRGGSRVLKTLVPLAEMFGYATSLRTLTQGRGIFSMEFYRYEPAPPAVTKEIVARVEGRIPVAR
jgi:elongation factor G